MKQCHRKYGVLSPGTESLPTIPVRALNQYMVFLSRCIQESCTENTIQLYGHDLVTVIVHDKHSKSNLQRWPLIHWIFPCTNWHHRRLIVCVHWLILTWSLEMSCHQMGVKPSTTTTLTWPNITTYSKEPIEYTALVAIIGTSQPVPYHFIKFLLKYIELGPWVFSSGGQSCSS